MAHGDDAILAPVDDEHVPAEPGEGGAIGLRAHGEVVLHRAEQREIGRASLEGGAGLELVLHEEPDLVRIGLGEAALEALHAYAPREEAPEDLAHPAQGERAVQP
jgi:hypothetical protein